MKKIYYLLVVMGLVLVGNTELFAQDRIYLKGMRQPQNVKVVEIGLDEIKYKPAEDSTSPVLVYSRLQVDRVVLSNGSVFEFKNNNPDGIETDYANQRKTAIKINPFSPLYGHTAFSLEHCTKPGRSYELGLSFIGLGKSYSEFYDVAPKPAGTTLRFGYKMINTPNYYSRGMRQSHILKGGYLKPELALSFYQITRSTYDYQYYSSRLPDTERRDVIAGAFLMNFGYQWVVSDCVSFDTYLGFGVGFCNYNTGGNRQGDPEFVHYGYMVIPLFPLALTGGFRMGYLLK